jgi:hypothetical protein
MNFLGNVLATLILVTILVWIWADEERCEFAQRQILAYTMCDQRPDCEIDKNDISTVLFYMETAKESCKEEE